MDKLEVVQYVGVDELRGIKVHDRLPRIVGFINAFRPVTVLSPNSKYWSASLNTNRGKVCNLIIFDDEMIKFVDHLVLRKILLIKNVSVIPAFEQLRWGQLYEASFDIALHRESTIHNFGKAPSTYDIKITVEEE